MKNSLPVASAMSVGLLMVCVQLAWSEPATDSTAVVAPPAAPAVVAPPTQAPNTLYYLNGEQLIKVEETPVDYGHSIGAGAAMGFGGAKTWITLVGTTSELKIAESKPRFRMTAARDLALRVRLAAFEVKDNTRRARTDMGKVLEFLKQSIPLEMNKVSDGVYEFVPVKPLKPGEYGLAVSMAGPVADFTVVSAPDSKGSDK